MLLILPVPTAYVSVERVSAQHGDGTIRVMAVRADLTPAAGETVITLESPCGGMITVVDTLVDYSLPGLTEDGAFFDFIVADSQCHGRYIVRTVVYDSVSTINGSTTFKY